MSDPSNNDDDLLLLTMRVDTDEDSLSELNRKMLALRETMQDVAKTSCQCFTCCSKRLELS